MMMATTLMERKKGIVGIEQPQSREGGKKGGDPTKSNSPFGKKSL